MKLLLHTCCAPCAVACIDALRDEGMAPVGFWFNPNIHPMTEYESRKQALADYAGRIGMELILRDEYGLRPFVRAVADDIDHRCAYCYGTRMEAAAQTAAQNGFDGFSTTLLISPYQQHDEIRRIAQEAAARHGVAFIYRDFRPRFREGQRRAREMGLYMQKYCGCVFSEEERYNKKSRLHI